MKYFDNLIVYYLLSTIFDKLLPINGLQITGFVWFLFLVKTKQLNKIICKICKLFFTVYNSVYLQLY